VVNLVIAGREPREVVIGLDQPIDARHGFGELFARFMWNSKHCGSITLNQEFCIERGQGRIGSMKDVLDCVEWFRSLFSFHEYSVWNCGET